MCYKKLRTARETFTVSPLAFKAKHCPFQGSSALPRWTEKQKDKENKNYSASKTLTLY